MGSLPIEVIFYNSLLYNPFPRALKNSRIRLKTPRILRIVVENDVFYVTKNNVFMTNSYKIIDFYAKKE